MEACANVMADAQLKLKSQFESALGGVLAELSAAARHASRSGAPD